MKILSFILLIFFLATEIIAQSYTIDARMKPAEFCSSHLKMGGTNFLGQSFTANNFYLSVNNKLIIPITGDRNFTRYPKRYWDESIKKIKAVGIDIEATYVFCNLLEECVSLFDWTETGT